MKKHRYNDRHKKVMVGLLQSKHWVTTRHMHHNPRIRLSMHDCYQVVKELRNKGVVDRLSILDATYEAPNTATFGHVRKAKATCARLTEYGRREASRYEAEVLARQEVLGG